MKKLATLFAACFLMAGTTMNAQTCCSGSTTAPEIQTGFYTTSSIAINQNTPAPVLSTAASSDLPTVEYIVTKRNTPALDNTGMPDTTGGGGDVIIGADLDGIFMPNAMGRYNITLSPNDTFDLTAVGYDLDIIRELADSLLNGYAGNQPCCGLFTLMSIALGEPAIAGFCDSVNNAGIYGAADIHGMNEVLAIFDVFASGQTSLGTVISTLQIINSNGNFISSDCGGTGAANFLPYGINRNSQYGYRAGMAVAVKELSDVSLFMMYPNPANTDAVQVYFTTQQEVDLTINVVDAMGQRVYSQTLGNVMGNIDTTIPVADLSTGMYFVELTDGHSSQVHKLLVD